jgi:hypothetical protein
MLLFFLPSHTPRVPRVSILRPGKERTSPFLFLGIFFFPMTQGLVRFQQTGDFHFLTFNCAQRRPYLHTPDARDLFESALEKIRRKYFFVVSDMSSCPNMPTYSSVNHFASR